MKKKLLQEEISRIKKMMKKLNESDFTSFEDEFSSSDEFSKQSKFKEGDVVWSEDVGEHAPGVIKKVYNNIYDAKDAGEDVDFYLENEDREDIGPYLDKPVYLLTPKGETEMIHLEKDLQPSDMSLEDIEGEEDELENYCTNCGGSGEGMYDGSTCRVCGGSGVVKNRNRDY